MSICWIGIGANLGDSRASFNAALDDLNRLPEIQLLVKSGLYQTAPIGLQAGGCFSNAVFSLATTLEPLALLDRLQEVESALGRTRDLRWGPRPIDLDLLFFGDQVIETPRLTVPHPAAWYRRFVVDPLAEVAASFRHPTLGRSIGELQAELASRPLVVACFDQGVVLRSDELCHRFPEVRLVPATVGTETVATETVATEAGAILLKLQVDDWKDPYWHAKPVADLTGCPGDSFQRVIDFLGAVLDSPCRIGDW